MKIILKQGACITSGPCNGCYLITSKGHNSIYRCNHHPFSNRGGALRTLECIVIRYSDNNCWAYTYKGLTDRLHDTGSRKRRPSTLNPSLYEHPVRQLVLSFMDQINEYFTGAMRVCPCECSR